jgi:hypothetical protein
MIVALIGEAGQVPRLMLINPKEDTVLQNKAEGEVCVFVDSVGSWIIAPDGLTAAIQVQSVLDLKPLVSTQIDIEAEAVRGQFITSGSGQAMTYLRKEAEARACLADQAAPAPFLEAEALATGLTIGTIAQAVVDQADAWTVIGPRIEAARMAAKRAVDQATTVAGVNAAAAIDWQSVISGN